MGNSHKYMVCIHCLTYNQEAFIEDTLKGFVMQRTNFPFIAVAVDDFSTDRTAEIIRRYEKEYPSIIKGVYLQENYYSQRKTKKPFVDPYDESAKYVALCEGDDYWTDPFKLQKQVDFLETHNDFVMCCTAFTITYERREDEKVIVRSDKDEILVDDLLREYWIGTLTTLFRRDVFAAYKPPFSDLPMGDLPLWGHMALQGRIGYIPDITANYRQLTSSACHFVDPQKQYAFQIEAMRVREYFAQVTGKVSIASPAFSKNAHYYLDQCYEHGWFDFPMEKLWHFIEEYGHPSGYDRLKRWGLKSNLNYCLSKIVYRLLKKR